jgi:hypothetical protein
MQRRPLQRFLFREHNNIKEDPMALFFYSPSTLATCVHCHRPTTLGNARFPRGLDVHSAVKGAYHASHDSVGYTFAELVRHEACKGPEAWKQLTFKGHWEQGKVRADSRQPRQAPAPERRPLPLPRPIAAVAPKAPAPVVAAPAPAPAAVVAVPAPVVEKAVAAPKARVLTAEEVARRAAILAGREEAAWLAEVEEAEFVAARERRSRQAAA